MYGNRITHFESIEVFAYYLFYKYFIENQKAHNSDFGDFFHLFYLPYSKEAVLEKNAINFLKQIKQNHDVLQKVNFHNIQFIRSLK